jgi:hypothetical protein
MLPALRVPPQIPRSLPRRFQKRHLSGLGARNYKWEAHRQSLETLGREEIEALITRRKYADVAARAIRIESRSNLFFHLKRWRSATRFEPRPEPKPSRSGFTAFSSARMPQANASTGSAPSYRGSLAARLAFSSTRTPLFVKPMVCRVAENYGYPFEYASRPAWSACSQYLKFARVVRWDLTDLHPRDI